MTFLNKNAVMEKNYSKLMKCIDFHSINCIDKLLKLENVDIFKKGNWKSEDIDLEFENVSPLTFALFKLYYFCCLKHKKIKDFYCLIKIIKLMLESLGDKKIPKEQVESFFNVNDNNFNSILLKLFNDKKYLYLWLLK